MEVNKRGCYRAPRRPTGLIFTYLLDYIFTLDLDGPENKSDSLSITLMVLLERAHGRVFVCACLRLCVCVGLY